MIGYIFRQKGHHYLGGGTYDTAYTNLWKKVNKSNKELKSSWEFVSTIALHAIAPLVLDQFWRYSAREGRVSPPLALRLTVAAAGTAALFALHCGWQDTKNIYGRLLYDHVREDAILDNLLAQCKQDRWLYGINAKYYGVASGRMDLSDLHALCATVVGVYQSAAAQSSLLLSPSLNREANAAPLQKDLAAYAAKMLREAYVRSLKSSGTKPAIAGN